METLAEKKLRHAEYVAKWRRNNPVKQTLARKRAYDNRKRKAFLVIGGAVCSVCGCDEIAFLEFNHKNGGGCKEHRSNRCKPMMDRILTQKRKTEDLDCKCRVCNALDYLSKKNPEVAHKYKVIYEK